MQKFKIGDEESGTRIDIYLQKRLPETSRSFIRKLISDSKVLADGRTVKPAYIVRVGDVVEADFPEKNRLQKEHLELPVIYEDESCLVIDKPAGVLTHSKGVFNPEPTVGTFVRDYVKGLTAEREGIVHRLDRGTSGIIIVAKTADAQKWLQKQFSTRKVEKTYFAIVNGVPISPDALIDIPIQRNPKKPQSFRAHLNGKAAQTTYHTERAGESWALLRLTPKTGRTHQLRVHLQHLGHSIIGDTFYGGLPAKRLLLHASELEITLPSKQIMVFTSPLPPEFKEYMEAHP